jgi:predicted metal-dependent peptidase
MTHNRDDPFAILEEEAARQASAESALKAISAARARLILGRDAKSAFFATLALRLQLVIDWSCETMATDGRTLCIQPEFVTGLSPDELLGVLAHEVMHNALGHPFRRGHRDLARWNIACDLAVNPLLLDAGFTLPSSRIVPGEGDCEKFPKGKSADEYYSLLEENPPPSQEETASDPGGCGSVTDPSDGSPSETESVAGEWQVAVAQAEQAARTRGELPEGLARVVETIQHPQQDWREVLCSFVSTVARNDYSWSRPNRRYLWQGLYLPGFHSDELGEIVIAVDTSGSVNNRQLGQFAEAVNDILEAYDCAVTVLYHDTKVQDVHHRQSSDGPLTLTPVGGGGTSHVCIFDWLNQSAITPACVICLTDLETRFPDEVPMMPVLWAVIGDSKSEPPFGVRVSIG